MPLTAGDHGVSPNDQVAGNDDLLGVFVASPLKNMTSSVGIIPMYGKSRTWSKPPAIGVDAHNLS